MIIIILIAPNDYASATIQYIFTPGQTRLSIPVTIVDDSEFEGAEQFLGSLSTSAHAIIDIPITTVTIVDNDCKLLLPCTEVQLSLFK